MATWEEGLQQARNACEVWKKEATIANKKAELAMKEKDQAMLKLAQMQKEIDNLSGGPHLHVIRRVQDLKTAPVGVLKTIEWQLKKDLEEVEKVCILIYLLWTTSNLKVLRFSVTLIKDHRAFFYILQPSFQKSIYG